MGADAGQQFGSNLVGLLEGAAGEDRLVVQNLAAHDLVDPLLVDLELAQGLGQLDGVAAGNEIGRRALEHRHVAGLVGHRRDDGRRRRPRADHDDLLAGVVEIFRPGLRMDDLALEALHARPFRRVADRMAIVALAHPQEVGREAERLAGIGPHGVDRPEIVLARPGRGFDAVAVADVARDVVFLDHLAHVGLDLVRGGDRLAPPGLETIAEGVEIAVGADARILVGQPGAAEALLRLQDDEAAVRHLRGEVVGATDARNAGAADQDVEMLGLGGGLPRKGCIRHGKALS